MGTGSPASTVCDDAVTVSADCGLIVTDVEAAW